jgi:hypothetical protein
MARTYPSGRAMIRILAIFRPLIETMTFRLAPSASVDAFLAVDKRLQTEFAYQQPGLVRRTTARADDGEWIVIDLWSSAEAADACAARWEHDPLAQEFMSMIDRSTLDTARYTELD